MSDEEDDPLEDLYADKDSLDRERLANALKGLINVDRDSADPIYLEGYHELSNKQQFVAQLLFRRVIVALDRIDEDAIGLTAKEAAQNLNVGHSAVENYGSGLNFVKSDRDKGGYFLPSYAIEPATQFIADNDD